MALPLPRVVADIAPGGGIVTAMGGINALTNAMHETEYNRARAQYAPTTMMAEAASKLAYANLMGPQFLAKMLADAGIKGNLSEGQLANALSTTYRAGTGQGTGNAFLNMPGAQGLLAPQKRFSFTNWLQDKFRNKIEAPHASANALVMPIQPQGNRNALNPVEPMVGDNQGIANDNADMEKFYKLAEAWQKSPEGQAKIAETGNQNYLPDNPQVITNWGQRQQAEQKTFSQREGEFKRNVKQEEELGKLGARAINDIGESQILLSASGANINKLIDDFTNPDFMALRSQFPFLQDMQLKAASKLEDPAMQTMIGNIIGDLESFKQSTVNQFKGQTLKREFEFADKLKPSENDTVYTALGKLQSLKSLHDIAEKKNALISQFLDKDKMNLPEAIAKANKMVDIKAIENQAKNLTQPLHAVKNKRTGMTIYLTSQRAKELGLE